MVTGGGRGIGAACALQGARRGYAVCINYRIDRDAAERLVACIAADGGRAIAVRADVAAPDQVAALFEAVDAAFGPVTALVNNAGLTGKVQALADAPPAVLQQVVSTNLLGALYCSREAVLRMSTKRAFPGGGRGGAIVNLSSIAATLGSPNEYVWYAASKGGIDSITDG